MLYTICSKPGCRDGADPIARLILDPAGHLYGTTTAGGNYPPKCGQSSGCGVAFKLTTKSGGGWSEDALHRFANFPGDGWVPSGPLVMDRQKRLYGTTAAGGGSGCEGGCGTMYKLSQSSDARWNETLMHTFGKGRHGASPQGGVALDNVGDVYGVTALGGAGSCGCGVVYKAAYQHAGNWKYSVLHTFTGNDGALPVTLIFGEKSGKLYGTTILGGASDNGVIFELTR